MIQPSGLPRALLVVGIVLLVAPALFPVQPVLYHDTAPSTMENGSTLSQQGYTVIAYENLSTSGQQHYLQALRNDGEHFVPRSEGAPEFSYPTETELGELDYPERMRLQTVIVERPPNASLPPPDERVDAAERRFEHERERRSEKRQADRKTTTRDATDGATATETGPTLEEYRRQVARYDQMSTRTDRPPLFALQSLLRLLSVAGGVIALGTGGYLQSKP